MSNNATQPSRPKRPHLTRSDAQTAIHDSLILFGPVDSPLTKNDHDRRRVMQLAIDTIAIRYKLQSTREQLGLAIGAAAYQYAHWWHQNPNKILGLGHKEDIASLRQALKRAHKLLEESKDTKQARRDHRLGYQSRSAAQTRQHILRVRRNQFSLCSTCSGNN